MIPSLPLRASVSACLPVVSRDLDFTVIVAVVAVRMVQVATHEVIDVVAVRHRFMAAVGPVTMCLLVSGAVMAGGAAGRIGTGDRQPVFLDVAAVLVVQMAVVQVIGVAVVVDGRVAAVRPVLMVVAFVVSRHVNPFLPGMLAPRSARWHAPARSGSDRPRADP
jgi:hypothetical protein